MNYPAMLYLGGVLNGDPTCQCTVNDEAAEVAAMERGFSRWETKLEQKAGKTAPDVAASASFDKAAARTGKAGKGGKADA